MLAGLGILLVLQMSFHSWRLAILNFLILPFALVGGILATMLTGGVISLGSLVGFLTVLGIAARNGIMMVNHFQHLERYEGEPFGLELVLRGAGERLRPIVMTAATAGLAIVPLVIYGNQLVANHDWVLSTIAARWPVLAVDEYQDLGLPPWRVLGASGDCRQLGNRSN